MIRRVLICFCSGFLLFALTTACATSKQYKRDTQHTSANFSKKWPKSRPIFVWPTIDPVVFHTFNKRPQSLHEGISIGAQQGSHVFAAATGEILFAGESNTHLGKIIMIRHEKPWISIYGHLGRVKVQKGQRIKAGNIIGQVGASGDAQSPQVYFQVRYNREPVNPILYLHKAQ